MIQFSYTFYTFARLLIIFFHNCFHMIQVILPFLVKFSLEHLKTMPHLYHYSVTLGGFGVDRFYLGQWKEALGKLFSFGGLGVWTIVDVILIAVGYIGPADGSLYI